MFNLLIYIPMIAFAGGFWWKAGCWALANWRGCAHKATRAKERLHKIRDGIITNLKD